MQLLKVWARISNFIPHHIGHVITYPYGGIKFNQEPIRWVPDLIHISMVSKRDPCDLVSDLRWEACWFLTIVPDQIFKWQKLIGYHYCFQYGCQVAGPLCRRLACDHSISQAVGLEPSSLSLINNLVSSSVKCDFPMFQYLAALQVINLWGKSRALDQCQML